VVGKLASAVLPAGPAGSASIDGTDAWTVTKSSKNPDKARELIEFYLDAAVQKRQVLDTGWLPIRLSVLADPEVQAKAPNAAVVLEQAKHPYDSFVTPDYNQVTVAVGTEVQKALQGQKTAAQAIADAHDQVSAIRSSIPSPLPSSGCSLATALFTGPGSAWVISSASSLTIHSGALR
jgi:multiple sugar transport system substrate-binding protein